MTTQHTPAPWEIWDENHYFPGIEAEGISIIVFGETKEHDLGVQGKTKEEALANARRIVACVNACEGIPTEALEAGVVGELLKILEKILFEDSDKHESECLEDRIIAAAILSHAKGE